MDISRLMGQLTTDIQQARQELETKMKAGKSTDPEHMLKMQFAMQQYSSYINFSSTLMKSIKDMTSGIIAKI